MRSIISVKALLSQKKILETFIENISWVVIKKIVTFFENRRANPL